MCENGWRGIERRARRLLACGGRTREAACPRSSVGVGVSWRILSGRSNGPPVEGCAMARLQQGPTVGERGVGVAIRRRRIEFNNAMNLSALRVTALAN